MEYSEYEKVVTDEAKKKLAEYDITGVCTDTIKGSFDCGTPVEEAVAICVDDTLYWEGKF